MGIIRGSAIIIFSQLVFFLVVATCTVGKGSLGRFILFVLQCSPPMIILPAITDYGSYVLYMHVATVCVTYCVRSKPCQISTVDLLRIFFRLID